MTLFLGTNLSFKNDIYHPPHNHYLIMAHKNNNEEKGYYTWTMGDSAFGTTITVLANDELHARKAITSIYHKAKDHYREVIQHNDADEIRKKPGLIDNNPFIVFVGSPLRPDLGTILQNMENIWKQLDGKEPSFRSYYSLIIACGDDE